MIDIIKDVSEMSNARIKEVPKALMEPIFAAYPYKEDLILYGELHIFRVTLNLDIVWSFGAADIFVLCDRSSNM